MYADSKFFSERDELWEAGPDVPLCLNYVIPVPLDPYRGDIDTREQLEHLGRYESNFTDAGQFTIVMGWDPIDVGGGRYNGYAATGPLAVNAGRGASTTRPST